MTRMNFKILRCLVVGGLAIGMSLFATRVSAARPFWSDALGATDPDGDYDGDGLSNKGESLVWANPTDPTIKDSDNDGLMDGKEAIPQNFFFTAKPAPEGNYAIIDLGTGYTGGRIGDDGEGRLYRTNGMLERWKLGVKTELGNVNGSIGVMEDGSIIRLGDQVTDIVDYKIPDSAFVYFHTYTPMTEMLANQYAYEYWKTSGDPDGGEFQDLSKVLDGEALTTLRSAWNSFYVSHPYSYILEAFANVGGFGPSDIQFYGATLRAQGGEHFEVFSKGWKTKEGEFVAVGTPTVEILNINIPALVPFNFKRCVDEIHVNKQWFTVAETRVSSSSTQKTVAVWNGGDNWSDVSGMTEFRSLSETVNEPEGPYLVGKESGNSTIRAYSSETYPRQLLPPIGNLGNISNNLVVPLGNSIFRNGQWRFFNDLVGSGTGWSNFKIDTVSPKGNLLTGKATKNGGEHLVLLMTVALSSPEASNSPQYFSKSTPDDLNLSRPTERDLSRVEVWARKLNALVIFYDALLDEQTGEVSDFKIDLEATLKSESLIWAKISGPESGRIVLGPSGASYRNPKIGGLYRFDLTLFNDQKVATQALLPLAGADCFFWLYHEIVAMREFAQGNRAQAEIDCYSPVPGVTSYNLYRTWVKISASEFDYVIEPRNADESAPTLCFKPDVGSGGGSIALYSYVTMKGTVLHGSKLNVLLWAAFGRYWGYTASQIALGANLNELFRKFKLDSESSQTGIYFGATFRDIRENQGVSTLLQQMEEADWTSLVDPVDLIEEKLWPCQDQYDEDTSLFQRPNLSTSP